MQAEQISLEDKNHELSEAYKEKAKAQQQTLKLYQGLKAQVMVSHVAHAAGDEAEYTLQTARRDRFIDRLPGTRTESAPLGTPSNPHKSRLPVLGGTRQNPYLNPDAATPYQSSTMTRQPLAGSMAPHDLGNFARGGRSSGRPAGGHTGGGWYDELADA
ncbi:predicted protein [Pyrenophora tritici-repentis Pt-1C-BFP]|uniref:Uncharacterized protein n=1 Tax=Pyrenophora tritici-repentis (strain Pt-1C-BFP) TaxID=426418 RepID=B2VR01_PYRTR|nr:uncharacterized protein PTRG_00555 [Pyrenophora tritici-repentis Pt-1C-BFP]EDU39993.1 predicted protein [Pyrenophora tritici-repentis Pt-1C-BFP]